MKITAIRGIILLLMVPFTIYAKSKSDDQVIVTIDNQKVTKAEFLRVYNKNNSQGNAEIKSFQEYMDMFVNYKLKVIEAEHEGYDTTSSFKSEFKNYKDQLSKQYFTDNATEENLLKEAYARFLIDVHVRTIIIKIKPYALPADTLEAYNRAIEVRNRLLKGEPWDSLALKYSTDPNVKKTLGDVNYFTAFQMKYPFESAAYTTAINGYSVPVRIQNGYYIIQVLDRKPSRGQLRAEHIMIAFPEIASRSEIDSAHKKINDIYAKIKAGQNFEELAKQYSDDHRSAVKGGDLGWFGLGQMIPDFENAAFALKNDGDISEPIRTTFGWHIIKRLEHSNVTAFETVQDNLKQRIQQDERAKLPQLAIIENVKNEIKFKDNPQKIYLLKPFLDSSIFTGKWDALKAISLNKEVLFNLGKKQITVKDFADYIAVSKKYRQRMPFDYYLYAQYGDFVNDKIHEFHANRLEEKYPDFKFLVQEYHDGILLFNLMDEKIWTQAAKDTIGLQKYYDEHKDIYKWGDRINALVITSTNKDYTEAAYKFSGDYYAGKIKFKEILKSVCHGDTLKPCINITETAFEKGDNTILDSVGWEPGVSKIVFSNGKFGFFVKKEKLAPSQKSFQDVKGTCIADYQAFLEQKFITELRKKYKVEVNKSLLSSLKK